MDGSKSAYEYSTNVERRGKIRKIDVIHRRDPDERSCEGGTKREREREKEVRYLKKSC